MTFLQVQASQSTTPGHFDTTTMSIIRMQMGVQGPNPKTTTKERGNCFAANEPDVVRAPLH